MQLLHTQQWGLSIHAKIYMDKEFSLFLLLTCSHSLCTATSGFRVLCWRTHWWQLLREVRVSALNSNFCPCITGPVSTLWEELTLIKNRFQNFGMFSLSLSGSLGHYGSEQKRADDQVFELFQLCHLTVRDCSTQSYNSYHDCSMPVSFNQSMVYICTATRT